VSISQPPREGRGRQGSKPGSGSGTGAAGSGSRKPPSTNGRNGAQPGERTPRNQSQKTAGNRQVSAKTVTQRPGNQKPGNQRAGGRPGDRNKPGAPRGAQNVRGGGRTTVKLQSRRPSPTILGIGAIFVVLVVVLVLVLVGTSTGAKSQLDKGISTVAPASLVSQVTGVPESVSSKVGLPSEIVNYPKKVTGFKPLTDPGLPEMLYMGAEYCPFCAAERWSMVMALSRFGTFTGLHTTYSSATDFAPDTPTFSFHGSTYTSPYLAFRPYELATNEAVASSTDCNVNGYACLDSPPQSDLNLLTNKSLGGGSFPFMDFGNKLYQSGAAFENQPLALQGYTYDQIASQLYDANSAIAQAEVGSANYLTAAICAMTGNKPVSVCSAPYIKTAQKKAGIS
jgi:hypothetical protein